MATPETNVPVPRTVVPSLNVTVPVGRPAPGVVAATVAVKVRDWPYVEEPAAARVVVVVEAAVLGSSGILGVERPTTTRSMSLASSGLSVPSPVTSPIIIGSIAGYVVRSCEVTVAVG